MSHTPAQRPCLYVGDSTGAQAAQEQGFNVSNAINRTGKAGRLLAAMAGRTGVLIWPESTFAIILDAPAPPATPAPKHKREPPQETPETRVPDDTPDADTTGTADEPTHTDADTPRQPKTPRTRSMLMAEFHRQATAAMHAHHNLKHQDK